MKKVTIVLVANFLLLLMPQATAANTVIRITAPVNQTFAGEFRNSIIGRLWKAENRTKHAYFASRSRPCPHPCFRV